MVLNMTKFEKITANETKIKALMSAKDDLERGLHKLRVEGFTSRHDEYSRVEQSIHDLRLYITGLQTGRLPFVTLQQEHVS